MIGLVALVAVGGWVVLEGADKLAEVNHSEAAATLARAELTEIRAAAEHQRAVDAETRLMLNQQNNMAWVAVITGNPFGIVASALVLLVIIAVLVGTGVWAIQGMLG